MEISITVNIPDKLTDAMDRLAEMDLQPVIDSSLVQMLNRARAPGGTPVRTGQLRDSSGIAGNEMGYTKEYARKVEYDYGRHYLQKNVEAQVPLLKKDTEELIKKTIGE